jgi:hypothetical protein
MEDVLKDIVQETSLEYRRNALHTWKEYPTFHPTEFPVPTHILVSN